MRRLWEDHIVWTRLAIISLTTGSPDTEATVGRLLKNQTDIGNAVKPFYGKAAGNELTAELRQHILIAADVVAAAKAGDQAKLADAQARWQQNADDIAAVLNSVNPRFWKLAAMKAEMRTHLTLTTQEAVARLQGNWTADVAAYDKIHRHILHMSDLLSDRARQAVPEAVPLADGTPDVDTNLGDARDGQRVALAARAARRSRASRCRLRPGWRGTRATTCTR